MKNPFARWFGPPKDADVADRMSDAEPVASRGPVAPWPGVDRYPTILGSGVTLQYITSVFRLSLTGYRREYCDVLDELLERDPHTYAVCAQRIHAVAGGRIEVVPAQTDPGSADEKRALEIRDYVESRIKKIPDWQKAISQLQWGGLFFGVGCAEINWRQDELGWYPAMLHWVHSRRIAYPDPCSWRARIWDQGYVTGWGGDLSSNLFGVGCDDFPGKFIVHTPSVRGNYPTRDGLGREIAYWSAIKLMGARNAGQYVERFSKPWLVGYYSTQDTGEPRSADDDDIDALSAAAKAIGIGSLSNAVLPDSTKIEMMGPAANTSGSGGRLIHERLVNLCNAEISKAVLGQTDTTEAGPNGSRSSTETRKKGTYELYHYDAACLADTLENCLIRWIVRLNFPNEEHLCPKLEIYAAEAPDIDATLDRAIKMAASGAPVDMDALAEEIGVKLLPEFKDGEQPSGRRLTAVKPSEIDPTTFGLVSLKKQTEMKAKADADALEATKAAAQAKADNMGSKKPTDKTQE